MFSRTMHRPRRIAATIVTGAALVGLAPVAPALAAYTPTYQFVPIRLTVNDIEDWWPDSKDEPRMYYGNAVWAAVVGRGGYDASQVGLTSTTFTGTAMSVDLWERDGSWTDNNFLGHATVTNDLLDQEKLLRFKGPGYDYEIVYKVVQIS